MIIAWQSKKFKDIIPFERIICVKSGMTTGSFVVRLEDDNYVSIFPDEADDFFDAYETYIALVEIQTLQLDVGDLGREKKDKSQGDLFGSGDDK